MLDDLIYRLVHPESHLFVGYITALVGSKSPKKSLFYFEYEITVPVASVFVLAETRVSSPQK